MASTRVEWDMPKLGDVIGKAPEVKAEITSATERICTTANSMGSGFRTGLYHRDHKSPAVGDTQPVYESDVRVVDHSVVGIVYTGNYSAMVDNGRSNTLLKAVG